MNEKNEVNAFTELLNQLGDWPVLAGTTWNESNFNLTEMLIDLRQNGLSHDIFGRISMRKMNKEDERRRIWVSSN